MVLALTLVLVLTLALALSGMISKKGVPDFCPSTVLLLLLPVLLQLLLLLLLLLPHGESMQAVAIPHTNPNKQNETKNKSKI